jgi:[ribosomal protein S18]-alanine N-acetyltransferase
MPTMLRTANESDFTEVATWVRSAEECDRWAGRQMPFPLSGGDLQRQLQSGPRIVAGETRSAYVLCDESGALLGYGELVRESGASFRLARIIVAPAHRGCGAGTLLCRSLMEKLPPGIDAGRIRLLVYCDNAPAIRLYSRLGFTPAGGFDRPDVMWMQRAFAAGS